MLYVYRYSDLAGEILNTTTMINGKWVPCRPEPWSGLYNIVFRFRAAWEVFRGRADAFTWPEGQ